MVAVRRRFSAETVERHQTFRRRSMNKDLGEKFSGARENAANALDASREKASELGDEVRMRGTKIIQENPLASLAGGMALGVMLAAFLPKRKGRKSAAASKIAAGLLAAKGVSASASDRIVRTKARMRSEERRVGKACGSN